MRFVWILVLFFHSLIETTVPASVSNTTQCESPKMKCKTGECIPKESICDGILDCSNEEDEMNCTISEKNNCRSGYSPCSAESICISNSFICDGQEDCSDGSDELNCEEVHTTYSCSASDSFVCKTTNEQKVCVPRNATCNEIKECPLGDDENNCEDFKSCAIQEHKCQHFCEDRSGSFVCGCAKGFRLESDGRTCKYESDIDSAGYLLASYGSEIHQIPLADIHRDTKYTALHYSKGSIHRFDYMRQNDEIFMAIVYNSGRSPGELAVLSKGREKTLRENIYGGYLISVDWIGKNMFYTQDFRSSIPGIFVCTTNGLFCRRIVEGESKGQMYFGLVVHPMRGLIVWIDYNKLTKWRHIMMSNMDGSEVRYLVESKSSVEAMENPTFLAIDHVKNDVYFVDDTIGMIERINIDTKKRHGVFPNEFVHLSRGMVYSNGFLYWSRLFYNNLMVQELAHNQTSPHVMHKSNSLLPLGLAINVSAHQIEPSSNPCKELDCPWLCVVVPKSTSEITAKCLCPDGYTPSGDTCIPFSPLDEMEVLKNYSHIGFELMSEYCKTGVACKNGGSCRQLSNETRIVCDCKQPYDGLYCERNNSEIHVALKEFKTQFSVSALIFIFVLALLIVGCGILAKFAKRKLSSPRSLIDDMTKTARNISSPLVNKLRKIIGKKQEPSVNFVRGEKILVENLPTTFNNPLFDEAPSFSINSSAASFSSTIRIEDDSSSL